MYRLKSGKHRFQGGKVIVAGDVVPEPIPKSLVDRVEKVDSQDDNDEDDNDNDNDLNIVPSELSTAVLEESGETIGIWLETVSDLKMIKALRESEEKNQNRVTVLRKFDKRISDLSS